MSSMNQVNLVGRLARDPEIRSMQNGRKLANLGVATTEYVKDGGASREKTQWHGVVVFNQHTVGFAEKYLKKGCLVAVTGKMEYRRWKGQDGVERTAAEVVIGAYDGDVKLLARPMGEAKPEATQSQVPAAAGAPSSEGAAPNGTGGLAARGTEGDGHEHEHVAADERHEGSRKVSANDPASDIPF